MPPVTPTHSAVSSGSTASSRHRSKSSGRRRLQKSYSTESSLNHMVPNSPIYPQVHGCYIEFDHGEQTRVMFPSNIWANSTRWVVVAQEDKSPAPSPSPQKSPQKSWQKRTQVNNHTPKQNGATSRDIDDLEESVRKSLTCDQAVLEAEEGNASRPLVRDSIPFQISMSTTATPLQSR